jgi:hypothetical protein
MEAVILPSPNVAIAEITTMAIERTVKNRIARVDFTVVA